MSAPADVEVTDGSQAGTKVFAAKLQTERGMLTMSTVMFEGKILGLAIEGPSIDNYIPQLFIDHDC